MLDHLKRFSLEKERLGETNLLVIYDSFQSFEWAAAGLGLLNAIEVLFGVKL